jgi:hypothetical protein
VGHAQNDGPKGDADRDHKSGQQIPSSSEGKGPRLHLSGASLDEAGIKSLIELFTLLAKLDAASGGKENHDA